MLVFSEWVSADLGKKEQTMLSLESFSEHLQRQKSKFWIPFFWISALRVERRNEEQKCEHSFFYLSLPSDEAS